MHPSRAGRDCRGECESVETRGVLIAIGRPDVIKRIEDVDADRFCSFGKSHVDVCRNVDLRRIDADAEVRLVIHSGDRIA